MLKIGDFVVIKPTSSASRYSRGGLGQVIHRHGNDFQTKILRGNLSNITNTITLPIFRLKMISKEEYETRCVLEDFS